MTAWHNLAKFWAPIPLAVNAGPFDALIGFSQGAIVATLATAIALERQQLGQGYAFCSKARPCLSVASPDWRHGFFAEAELTRPIAQHSARWAIATQCSPYNAPLRSAADPTLLQLHAIRICSQRLCSQVRTAVEARRSHLRDAPTGFALHQPFLWCRSAQLPSNARFWEAGPLQQVHALVWSYHVCHYCRLHLIGPRLGAKDHASTSCARYGQRLKDCFLHPMVMEHDEGHKFPSSQDFSKQLAEHILSVL